MINLWCYSFNEMLEEITGTNKNKEKADSAQPSTTEWVCNKGHRNIEYSKNITGRCRVCGEVDSMLRKKPHYKWSWKLDKAVRL